MKQETIDNHRKLWSAILERFKTQGLSGIYLKDIKQEEFKKLFPDTQAMNNCFLCEEFANNCTGCPMNTKDECLYYDELWDAVYEGDLPECIRLSELILNITNE